MSLFDILNTGSSKLKNPRNLPSGGICKKSEDRGNMNIFSIDLELWKESLTSQGMARRDRFLLHFPQRRTVVYGACQKSKPGSIFCNLLAFASGRCDYIASSSPDFLYGVRNSRKIVFIILLASSVSQSGNIVSDKNQ